MNTIISNNKGIIKKPEKLLEDNPEFSDEINEIIDKTWRKRYKCL